MYNSCGVIPGVTWTYLIMQWVICVIIFLIRVNLGLINSEMKVIGAY